MVAKDCLCMCMHGPMQSTPAMIHRRSGHWAEGESRVTRLLVWWVFCLFGLCDWSFVCLLVCLFVCLFVCFGCVFGCLWALNWVGLAWIEFRLNWGEMSWMKCTAAAKRIELNRIAHDCVELKRIELNWIEFAHVHHLTVAIPCCTNAVNICDSLLHKCRSPELKLPCQ